MIDKIIKQAPAIKVINSQQLSMLAGVKEYCNQITRETEERRMSTELECESLRRQLEETAKAELERLSQQLYIENENHLKQLTDHLEAELYPLFYKIINKLQIKQFSSQQIGDIIKNELYELIKNKQVTLICHPESLEYLKSDLSNIEVAINYLSDPGLIVEQCVLKCDLADIYIDIADCRGKILELFKNH